MKTITISNIVKVVRPEYVYIKLKPNNSIRNNKADLLPRTISALYKNIWQNIKKEQDKVIRFFGKEITIGTKWSYHLQGKIAYYIYIEKKKVEFFFIIPKHHYSIIKEKVGDIWSGVTIETVKGVPMFSESAIKRQLVYQKEDGLSLRVDKRDNDLLHSNLSIIDVLEDRDKVGILYNFIPSSQGSFIYSYKATMSKVKKGMPVERDKMGFAYIFKMSLSLLDNLFKDITEAISGKRVVKDEDSILDGIIDKLNGGRRVSEFSERKGKSQIINTQILIMSDSENTVRKRNNAVSLAQSFDVVSDDNRLISKPFKGKIDFHANIMSGAEINRVSDGEAQSFINLAGREILERYNFIEKVETQETEVPDDLQKGVMCIGENTFRGHKKLAYLSNDSQYRNLLTLLIGPTRAGKSTLIGNLCRDAIQHSECAIIFDFIENCELSNEVASLFPIDKVLNIECDSFETMQGLGYNEVGFSPDVFKQYENAKRQTSNMLALVNSINTDESRLSPKMERYLESASLVVFISNGSIRDVFNVLTNYSIRNKFITKVPASQHENLGEYMESLMELDEKDNKGNPTGETKTTSIVGILDRLNALKRNAYMEMMLKKDTSRNINLVDEMQKNQLICIRMPQNMFTTDGEKDVYTTYWITKIWLALQVRADLIREKEKRRKVNLIIDEIYQVNNTEKFLTSKLSQMAKFIAKPIISCHYINQLKFMREELRSANTSYMLIAGCDSKNFRELKNELYPYTEEDLKNLPRYHSLNYVKCKSGYARFITALPKPVQTQI